MPFVRGDYKELVELSLLYLGDTSVLFKSFKKPGALHKARWMSKILYSIKIVLLSPHITKAVGVKVCINNTQFNRLQNFVNFVVYVYVSWWLQCPIATAAPTTDLDLIYAIIEYKEVNPVISKAGLDALSEKHTWYLTEELVPLALFSSIFPLEEKQRMVDKINEFGWRSRFTCQNREVREGIEYGKPLMPAVPTVAGITLTDFVGKDSSMFFRILNLSPRFPAKRVEEWEDDESYLEAMVTAEILVVVNDAAERGVKLCHDFLGYTGRITISAYAPGCRKFSE